MINITVVGSSRFRHYVEEISRLKLFPQVKLQYVSDRVSMPSPERFQFVLEDIGQLQPAALVMGPRDYDGISPHTGIPCCVVYPSLEDFLSLHTEIENYEKTAVILSDTDYLDLSILEKALGIHYVKFHYTSSKEVPALIHQLKNQGFYAVIANGFTVDVAQKAGMKGYYFFGQKSVEGGIRTAIQVVENLEREQMYLDKVQSILDKSSCGAICVSGDDPTVNFVNQTALTILKQTLGDILQKTLTDLFPTHICQTIQNCTEEVNNVQFDLCGISVLANIVPIEISDTTHHVTILFEKTDYILKRETIIRQGMRRKEFGVRYTFDSIKGNSTQIKKTISQAMRYAKTDSTIYIQAETGSGKEVFAQSIHDYSRRRDYPFVAINCASIPDTLIESELFGYTAGAFTGANRQGKRGLIDLANHGTMFLDDIDGLSYSFQSKLLRVIQEHEIIRVGGSTPIPIDVRFIVATNRNLRQMVLDGQFRNDLYFRINVLQLPIPPLRERKEDIADLWEYYLEQYAPSLYQNIKPRLAKILRTALHYSYPGNVRELINLVERFATLADLSATTNDSALEELLSECMNADLDMAQETSETISIPVSGNYKKDVLSAEQHLLQYYKDFYQCSITELAKKLEISRPTIYNKIGK